MIKVAFSGARGVGKSTLVENLFCNLDKQSNGKFSVIYRDGVARKFFELCKSANIKNVCVDTKEVCIAGQLITNYLEDVCDKDNGIVLYSRSLFDLYAYWHENIVDILVKDIYKNKPLDLLVVLLTDADKFESFIRVEAESRGYDFTTFASMMEIESGKILNNIFKYSKSFYFNKLILLNNDYTNKTLQTNTALLTDVILRLYNEQEV